MSTECRIRKRLSKIRCLTECIKAFRTNDLLPESFCYVPHEVKFSVTSACSLTLYSFPAIQSAKVDELHCLPTNVIVADGWEECNKDGVWMKAKCVKCPEETVVWPKTDELPVCWLLIMSAKKTDQNAVLVREIIPPPKVIKGNHLSIVLSRHIPHVINRWQELTEYAFSFEACNYTLLPCHTQASAALRQIPRHWTIEHDEDLVYWLHATLQSNITGFTNMDSVLSGLEVSSQGEDDGPQCLLDEDPDTFWETDGQQGKHWIRLTFKQGVTIKKLMVILDPTDENYLPSKIEVHGGPSKDKLRVLNKIKLDSKSFAAGNEIVVLEDQETEHNVVEIHVKECRDDGIDTRVRGLKLIPQSCGEFGLSRDLFVPQNFIRFPRLEGIDKSELYHRSVIVLRFMELLDSLLSTIAPMWSRSVVFPGLFKSIRHMLPLSRKRHDLIDSYIKDSETKRPLTTPEIFVNRQTGDGHLKVTKSDPDYSSTVFMQLYNGLRPKDLSTHKFLDYRWPTRYEQWWICKFVSEGIIDQGGGFRDSLADMSDELCPNDPDAKVVLPLFIRAPNFDNVDANVNKDVFVPNPDCKMDTKYEWIGKLMGACIRGKEFLVLPLSTFTWKKLVGEEVTWSKDYLTVDALEVRLCENMLVCSREDFEGLYSEKTWSLVLSSGRTHELRPGGEDINVTYEERAEYVSQVKDVRMAESDRQIEAIRKGLLSVVPWPVLELLTWQELEGKVSGNSEITIDGLKKSLHLEDLKDVDTRVQYLWEALKNFSQEDRSRFLRFTTGRRRLPTKVYVCPDRGTGIDNLPESSTCANTLYMPTYTSAQKCEEKLRYAIYNCIAIDTDMSPWDD